MEKGVHIDFAYRTFVWNSEANTAAHVHCVIIGFSTAIYHKPKVIFNNDRYQIVDHINGYLLAADDIYIESRQKPLCDVPEIGIGNKPIDNGYYIFEKEEMEEFIKKEPDSKIYFHPWFGAKEFISCQPRYCLWLGDCSPAELKSMPQCMKRVEAVQAYRLASKSHGTVKLADQPTRFHVENMPKTNYIVIPEVSSQRRRYIPMGFMTPDVFCGNLVKLVPNATFYRFGVLESSMHTAWIWVVGGRLKSDYRYGKEIVYNNFPWSNPTKEQKEKIEQTAKKILDARDKYPDSSLADLYDEITMPADLRNAYYENDMAVIEAYVFKTKGLSECNYVSKLFKLYQDMISWS